MQAVKQQRSWGVAEVILLLSIAILVIVVVVPVALIFFNAFFVKHSCTFHYNLIIILIFC